MEDISRELEKEIARSKPKPYIQNKKTRVLVVDDFGEMKSGDYLKILIKGLSIVSIVCFVTAGVYFYLYTGLNKDADLVKNRLTLAEKKVNELIQEREVLMARLVIAGQNPVIEKKPEKKVKPEKKEKPNIAKLKEKTQPILEKPQDKEETNKNLMIEPEKKISGTKIPEKIIIEPELNTDKKISEIQLETEPPLKVINKTISIEKFVVTNDGSTGNLLVRFDIRNISKKQKDVSGRIFTILKPDNSSEDQWLVVPSAILKKGIPSEYKKGQYFSISHFKPVKFRIKNKARPDFFKTASIFIFNEQAELIFEKLIDITNAQ